MFWEVKPLLAEDIIVPAVIPKYVTKRVLAMEFVKGVKITDYAP